MCLLLEKGHADVYRYGLGWFYEMADTVMEMARERADESVNG